jgi:carboxypeptidase D
MFLRFIGVSDEFLNAAGPAATIPSRIGSEREAVLGSTLPNGTALSDTSLLTNGTEIEKLLNGNGGIGESGSDGKSSLSDGLGGGSIEGLINASSAIVLVLIMLLAFGGFMFFRRKFGTKNRFNRRGDGGGWGALGRTTTSGSGGGGSGRSSKRHSRSESLGRGGGMGMGMGESTEEEEQELDELIKSRRRAELEEQEDEEARLEGKGKGKARAMADDAYVFDLGAEDEDEDDSEEQRRRYR